MSGNIYMDIIASQVAQGNMGGKKGQFGYLVKKEKKDKKVKRETFSSPVAKKEKDEFEINLISGTVAKATDSNGLSDPYIELHVKKNDGSTKSIWTSKSAKKTLTPQWDEKKTVKLQFDSTPSGVAELVVELWDFDLLSRNDYIGTGTITVSGLKYGVSFNDPINCYSDESYPNAAGTVNLTITKKHRSSSASMSSC